MAKKVTEKEIITTYNGKEIVFYPNSHKYKFADRSTYLVSPSKVVDLLDKSEALLKWNNGLIKAFFEKIEEREYQKWEVLKLTDEALLQREIVVEEAQEVGKIIHAYAQSVAICKSNNLPVPEIPAQLLENEQVMNGIGAFLRFEVDNKIEYLEAERFVYSENNYTEYVGQLDTILSVNGVKILGDYKTSKYIYTSHFIQVGGYDLAITEEYAYRGEPMPYEKVGIIHFDKNTGAVTLRILTDEERQDAQLAFKALLTTKEILKRFERSKNK